MQAGLHNRQVLIGEGDVEHRRGTVALDQRDELLHVVGVHLRGGQFDGRRFLQLFLERVAFGFGTAGDAKLAEYAAVFAAFVNRDRGDAAAADDKQFAHNATTLSFASVFFFLD